MNVVTSGPDSASCKPFNQATLTRIVTTLGNVFPGMQPLKYNPVSLNEIINSDEDSITNESEVGIALFQSISTKWQ